MRKTILDAFDLMVMRTGPPPQTHRGQRQVEPLVETKKPAVGAGKRIEFKRARGSVLVGNSGKFAFVKVAGTNTRNAYVHSNDWKDDLVVGMAVDFPIVIHLLQNNFESNMGCLYYLIYRFDYYGRDMKSCFAGLETSSLPAFHCET